VTWADILAHETAIEADLHQVYGIDYEQVLDTRSWRWLSLRILGLLSTDCRIHRLLTSSQEPASGR
jgi:hypothetical protein